MRRRSPISPIRRIGPIGPIGPIGRIGLIGLISLMGLMGVIGCANPSREELAALAAEGYYRHLIAGEYEQFLEGKVGVDSLPESYREQLLTCYRQFIAQQQEKHGGIVDVSLSSVRTDSLDNYTSVFLILCYGDSTQEEVIVPMVDTGDCRWRMW